MFKTAFSAAIAVGLASWSWSASAAALNREPAMGSLKEGQRILVDDGSCAKGQIKEVIGGNHTQVGGSKQIIRQRRCILRT